MMVLINCSSVFMSVNLVDDERANLVVCLICEANIRPLVLRDRGGGGGFESGAIPNVHGSIGYSRAIAENCMKLYLTAH